jgi:hypothetical protein
MGSPANTANTLSIPDSPALTMGDIDVRWWGRIQSSSSLMNLIGQWDQAPNQRSWRVQAGGSPTVFSFAMSSDGSAQTSVLFTTVEIDLDTFIGLRVTRIVSSGATTLWIDRDGVWMPMETRTLSAGVPVFNTTANLYVGALPADIQFIGQIHRVELWNGIGGALVFAFYEANLIGVAPTANSFQAATGQTITVGHGGAAPTIIVPSLPLNVRGCSVNDSPMTEGLPYDTACQGVSCAA